MLFVLTGVWHTFDGVAYFPGAFSDGYFSRLKSKFFGQSNLIGDRFRHDAIASAKVFLPSAEDICKASLTAVSNGQTTMEGYLEKIDQVMSSLRLQMFKDPHQHFVDESLVQKVCEIVYPHVLADLYFYTYLSTFIHWLGYYVDSLYL